MLFNAGCNEQVFSKILLKNLAQIRHVVFEKDAKNAPLIPKMTSPSRRLGCFNKPLNY